MIVASDHYTFVLSCLLNLFSIYKILSNATDKLRLISKDKGYFLLLIYIIYRVSQKR